MLKKNTSKFLKDQKGDGIITFLMLTLIALILMLLSVTVYEYMSISRSLDTATTEVLSIMKFENGADFTTKEKFNELLTKMKVDPSTVTFEATPKLVQRGELLEVKATKMYNVFALKMIGVDFEVKITAKATGLAHKFIR